MDNSTVFVSSPRTEDDDGNCSVEDFSIVGRLTQDDYTPSLNTALDGSGCMYEQRTDIKELKEMKERIKKKLQLYAQECIDDIRERVDARKNIDEEIEHEIKELEDLLNKDQTEKVNDLMIESGKSALESMRETKQVANKGETTLKRAMEIMQLAIPIFKSVWAKCKDDIQVDNQVMDEMVKFEEARNEVATAGLNIEKRKNKSAEFKEHISNAIKLAEVDVQKLMSVRQNELAEKRLEKCDESKAEINTLVQSESGEVDGWLVTCKGDKDEISTFRAEQIDRHEAATKHHEKRVGHTKEKIRQNKEKQNELMKQLEELKIEETKLEEEKRFQRKVQETAQKLHEDVMSDLTERFDILDTIQSKANTARKVVELMSTCGTVLTNSSREVEKEYLDKLLAAEKTGKERLRDALAHNAVETRIKVERSTKNLDDCVESMKIYKQRWKKAAEAQSNLNVKKNEEMYKEFKQEMKREKKIKEECEADYEKLIKKLEKLQEDLDYLKVTYQSLADMYETRMQEYNDINNGDSLGSLDSSDETSDDDDDDNYGDAMQ